MNVIVAPGSMSVLTLADGTVKLWVVVPLFVTVTVTLVMPIGTDTNVGEKKWSFWVIVIMPPVAVAVPWLLTFPEIFTGGELDLAGAAASAAVVGIMAAASTATETRSLRTGSSSTWFQSARPGKPTAGTPGTGGRVTVVPLCWSNPVALLRRTSRMWSVADDALVAGMAAGDADAASAFVERFQRRVYGLAYTIVGDARGAEDVAQEALLRAWRHAGVFDARRGSVTTWLLTITRNLAIDALRVRRPVAIDPDAVIDLAPVASGRGPAEVALVRDDVGRLREALNGLPDEQRRAVVLAGVVGLSAREVAEREDIPIGTAKTRIRTALGRLRLALASEERAE